jgi:predicted transposase/invertase (TIGR01784 family)
MYYFEEKYVNPFTDYGFKRIFGEEPNKELLLDFLNELLKEEQGNIVSLTYLKSDRLGSSEDDRKAIFDLYCENERGEKFIVELQKTKQKFFKDRTVYYSTFPIREQAIKGGSWTFELKAIYTIAILDFVFDEDKADVNKFRYDVKLTDIETYKVFYDKLTFIYLEMPKFNKPVELLESRFEKWMYVIRNLHKLNRLPEQLREQVFEKLFAVAEIAKFTPTEVQAYEDSLKTYRDLKNSLDTAREEGREEGKKLGRREGREEGVELTIEVINLYNEGKTASEIARLVNIEQQRVEQILNKLK